jgi:hypothetical protein
MWNTAAADAINHIFSVISFYIRKHQILDLQRVETFLGLLMQ